MKNEDALLEKLRVLIERDEQSFRVNVDSKVNDVKECGRYFETLASDSDNGSHETKINKPFKGSGSTTVVADTIVIKDTKKFVEMFNKASNMEVLRLWSGNIQLSFAFHGLMRGDD